MGGNIDLKFLLADEAVNLANSSSYYSRNSTGAAGDFDVSGYVDQGIGEIASFGASSPYNFQMQAASANSYHWYKRDNGDGTYMVLAHNPAGSGYTLAKVTGDPADFTVVTVEFKATPADVSYKLTNGERYADTDNANITLVAGGNISYAKAHNGQFTLNVAKTVGEMVTGTVPDAKVTKDYLEQEVLDAKVAGNTTYDNSSSAYPQAPTTVQSLGEAAKEQSDLAKSTADGAVVVNNTQNTNITAHSDALGVSNGDTDLGTFTNASLTDNAPLKTVLEEFADAELAEHTNVVNTVGTQLGDSDIGNMSSTIYTNGGTVKDKLEEVATAVEGVIATGTIDFPQAEYHHHYLEQTTPAGWEDGVTDVASLIIDPTGSNVQLDSLPVGTSILFVSDAGSAIDGLYVTEDAGAGVFTLARHTSADEASEFFEGRKIQIKKGGAHAGAIYQVQSDSVVTLDTDTILFVEVGGTHIGDGTLPEAKLDSTLAAKLNLKLDAEEHEVSTDVNGQVTISHSLGKIPANVIVWARTGSTRTQLLPSADVQSPTATTVEIGGSVSTDYLVIVIA